MSIDTREESVAMSIMVRLPVVRCLNDACGFYKRGKVRYEWTPRKKRVDKCPICASSDLKDVTPKTGIRGLLP